MKQILTITLLTAFLTLSAQAQNSEKSLTECQIIRAKVMQNITMLRYELENSDNDDDKFNIRLEIRKQFRIMDKTIVYALSNASCGSPQFLQMQD